MNGHTTRQVTRPPAGRTRSRRRRRTIRTLGVALLSAIVLTGCSGEGGVELPTTLPTTLPSVTVPSVTLPSVTLPSVTLPSVTLPTVTGPTVTGPTVTVTEDAPAPTTEAPAAPEEEEQEEATPEPEETAAPEAQETTEDAEQTDDGTNWLWLLLLLGAAAVVAAVVALVRRRRARQAWSASVDEALPEALWLRDSIVPDLIDENPDGRAGIWVVSRPRVVGLEEDLRRLVSQAPDPALARPVEALTIAVEALRRLLDQADALAGFGGPSVTAALNRSRTELDEAITAIAPPVPEGEPV